MTEVERLVQRLKQKRAQGMKSFHISWGPDAHLLSAEERARHVNDLFDQIDQGNYTPMDPDGFDKLPTNRQIDVRDLVARLSAEKCDPGDLEAISE